jgi:hypothetical protein
MTKRFDKTFDKPTTFAAMSQLALDETGGRYRATETTQITGSKTTSDVLVAPAWSRERAGEEPPLGYSINDQEPVGTPAEIKAAQELAEQRKQQRRKG